MNQTLRLHIVNWATVGLCGVSICLLKMVFLEQDFTLDISAWVIVERSSTAGGSPVISLNEMAAYIIFSKNPMWSLLASLVTALQQSFFTKYGKWFGIKCTKYRLMSACQKDPFKKPTSAFSNIQGCIKINADGPSRGRDWNLIYCWLTSVICACFLSDGTMECWTEPLQKSDCVRLGHRAATSSGKATAGLAPLYCPFSAWPMWSITSGELSGS